MALEFENGVVCYETDATNISLLELYIAGYECNPGFVLVGPMNRTCNHTGDAIGNWTGQASSCCGM